MKKTYHKSFILTEDGNILNILLKLYNKNLIISNTDNIKKFLELEGIYIYFDPRDSRPKANLKFENIRKHITLAKILYYVYHYDGNISKETIRNFLSDITDLEIDHLDEDKLNNTVYNLAPMTKSQNLAKLNLPRRFKYRFALTLCNDGQRCRAELLYLTGFDRLYSAKFFFDSPDDLVSCLKWLVRDRGRWKLRSRRYGVKVTDRTQYTTDYSLWSGCRIIPLVPMYERQKALAELPLTEFERWSKNAIE